MSCKKRKKNGLLLLALTCVLLAGAAPVAFVSLMPQAGAAEVTNADVDAGGGAYPGAPSASDAANAAAAAANTSAAAKPLSADNGQGAQTADAGQTAAPAVNNVTVTANSTLSPAFSPTPEPVLTAKISFTGDLMVHSWQADAAYDKSDGGYDFNHEFDWVRDDLSASDFTVGNLETTFAGTGFSDFPCFCAPDSFADALVNAGFDFVTTANNHCNDKRTSGILRTLDVLDAAGLAHAGTYRSAQEQNQTYTVDINGIKFAFLSYTYSTNGIPIQSGMPYLVNVLDKQLIKDQIDRAKALDPDVIVILPHMGVEYTTAPTQDAMDWAQYMLDCGADVVVASHPHVIQTVTAGPDGIIAYSMGNFVSCQRDVPRDYGMILNLEFQKTGDAKAVCVKASFVPTWVKFVNSKGAYDIQTLPVYDAIENYNADNSMLIRAKDYQRLLAVNKEITAKLLGAAQGPEREYVLYERP